MAERSKRIEGDVRQGVNTRITSSLRGQLEAAAKDAGRSLGAEIERRLEQSFAPADDLRQVIREEIQAALGEQRTPANGGHPMGGHPHASIWSV
jgi:hypothetical protein